jgi:hypothetical protein
MTRCRLIYTSISTDPFVSKEDLHLLLQQCEKNNREANISGLLLLSGDRFLQVLEGTSKAVNRLFCKLVADPRHHDVNIVSFEQIGPAYFEDWSMYLVDLYNLPMQQRFYLMRKYDHKDGVIRIPDKLHLVFSLLLDARALCLAEPRGDEPHSPA